MKNWITHEDIGKLFMRTGGIYRTYLRIKSIYDLYPDTDCHETAYVCDLVRDDNDNTIIRDVGQTNIDVYRYVEISELEVLVVCGVEL